MFVYLFNENVDLCIWLNSGLNGVYFWEFCNWVFIYYKLCCNHIGFFGWF